MCEYQARFQKHKSKKMEEDEVFARFTEKLYFDTDLFYLINSFILY